jgi:NADH:ubiquinone oxidoreductase subunit C
MFGIFFINNNSLKRILTDYGFKGHPLKKDFPLIGYLEIFYNAIIGEIIYKPVELTQEYRFYNIDSN